MGKQAKVTSDAIDEEVERTDKIMTSLEQYLKLQIQEVRKDLDKAKIDNEQWTSNFEDLQARKIVEIHQAIKVLNANSSIIQKDAVERFELLQG